MKTKTMAGLACAAGGTGCLAGAVYEGLHYSQWANPGALNWMVRLAVAALVLLAVPAVMIAAGIIRAACREWRALGLTPWQALVIQLTVMEVAHHEWAEHNAKVSERLAESVMGPARDWPAA